ncbi:MAG: oxidoreductase [Rhodospirillaceae bacterium BRH_c57]|nr:MAG: oxidoreductase [Rhodospirillaceae bacterium BRH_c57]
MFFFALIGCGRIARKHAEILGKGLIPDARLGAVCDIVPERAKELGESYGVPWFTDMHVMAEEMGLRIHVISILTESGLHARHCLELVRYGKHIVIEKPMALTLEDADEMIRACAQAEVKLFVVKQNRYNVPVQKLREAFDAGRFGRIVMGTVRVRWCRTQAYYDQAPWRGTWSLDGGVFANQASHHVDLLEWFLGEPVSVFAKSRTALVDIEAEDTGVAVVTFRSGAIGIIEATTATRPTDLEGSLSILGERGTVEIGGFAVNEMKTWNFAEPEPGDELVLERARENPPNVYGFGHVAYLTNVVESLSNAKRILVDGLEGRKSLELISAIYESIESGREIPLRFQAQYARLGVPT